MFVWGQAGHGQRSMMPNSSDNSVMPIDIRKDQSLPAFTNCSLDDNPGNGDPDNGDSEGQVNRWLYWMTDDIVDTATTWQITVALMDEAPEATTLVDVTPRRLQQFNLQQGFVVVWSNRDLGTDQIIQSGEVIADTYGLVTLPQVEVGKDGNRLELAISQVPVAAFTHSPERGNAPLSVSFADQSGGAVDTWAWDFDNDGTVDATQQNPTWNYQDAGTYTVKLTVSGPEGNDSLVKEECVEVMPEGMPVALFEATPRTVPRGAPVAFADHSSGMISSWTWHFGDGTGSTQQHPAHTYTTAGTYPVSLTVSGPVGADTLTPEQYIVVEPLEVQAGFSVEPTSTSISQTVQFTDTSSGDIDTWQWDFGDDTTSEQQHPTHQYTEAGTYTVQLTVSGPGGTDTRTRNGYVSVTNEPGFNLTPLGSGDDARESTGTVTVVDSYLSLGGIYDHKIGVRFPQNGAHRIPAGATITNAYLFLKARTSSSDPLQVQIYGENTAVPAPFSETLENIHARQVNATLAQVAWDVPPVTAAWANGGVADERGKSPDISTIVQEVIDTAGATWDTASALALIVDPPEDSEEGMRHFSSFDAESEHAPVLHVEYTLPLQINKVGDGSGVVTSTPMGIACGSTCSYDFDQSVTTVTLVPTPNPGSHFAGWSGDCFGSGSCEVDMNGPRQVTAHFQEITVPWFTLEVARAGDGNGVVRGSEDNIDCGGQCNGQYPEGTRVELTATPAAGSSFAGWQGGPCHGSTQPTCEVALKSDTSMIATFARIRHTIIAQANTGGAISPSGSIQVEHGGSQAFVLNEDPGYRILNLLVNDTSVGALSSYNFTNLTENATIHALFAPTSVTAYTVSTVLGEGGDIMPRGPLVVQEGQEVDFSITPEDGYSLEDVVINGTSQGLIQRFTLGAINSDQVIEVRFSRDEQSDSSLFLLLRAVLTHKATH